MRVALRCDRHRLAMVDPETGIIEIHCRKCSKAHGTPVYHHWRMKDGTIQGMDHDDDPADREPDPSPRRSRVAPDAWR